jgi:hypothetical protein
MKHPVLLSVALLATLWPIELPGQRPTGSAVIEGIVLDSATRTAPIRTSVCAWLPEGVMLWSACADVDTVSGAFRLDSLPEGRREVGVACGTLSIFGRTLTSDSIRVSAREPVRRNWTVPTSGCDRRPLRRLPGTFRGYYVSGFESSEFRPCSEDAWFLPGDSLETKRYDQRRAWARFVSGALDGFVWPRVRRRHGDARYYVEWRGTVVGPGHYGHMGISAFQLCVDSLITVRPPRRGDCQPLR